MATSRSEVAAGRPADPPPEVVAAIVAAVEVAWPRPAAAPPRPAASLWRFSNRWWMPRRVPVTERLRP